MTGAAYLATFKAPGFSPPSGDHCDQIYDYADAFIRANATLASLIDSAIKQGDDEILALLRSLPTGLRALYASVYFEIEVLNGGVAQFYVNCPYLTDEFRWALEFLGASNLLKLYAEVQLVAKEQELILQKYFYVTKAANATEDERYEAYEEWRQAIENPSEILEDAYFPYNSAPRSPDNPPAGALRTELCSKVCAYIEANPTEFQRLI